MNKLTAVFGGTVIAGFFILVMLIAPLILLASVNTIAEEAHLAVYIPHTVWTYLSCYGIMACLRGSSK